MKLKEIIADYLTFTRRERIGILIVLILLLILIVTPSIFTPKQATNLYTTDTSWITAVKKLELKENNSENTAEANNATIAYQYEPSKTNQFNKPAGELFFFDPNTLSKEGWLKLGLRDKTIKTIENYCKKGGHFEKPEDLQRVYGLRKNEYERLAPFIKIKTELKEKNTVSFTEKLSSSGNYVPSNLLHRSLSVDINSADTSAFIALPGIGSKLATRIVNFRDKLGGFYSTEQVRETFGLPDSTFQKIKAYLKLENGSVRKININSATVDVLKVHPYIKWNIANPIVAYRNEHGSFSNIEDIKKIMIITDDIYKKIAPYLVIH